jgi:hypothetical protein
MRNKILHQGYTLSKKRYAGYIFCPPGTGPHKHVDKANMMRLEAVALIDDVIAGMDRWIDDLLASSARLATAWKYLGALPWEDPASVAPMILRSAPGSTTIGGPTFPPIPPPRASTSS